MKILYIFPILLLFSCTNQKNVFWCGDHACLNKKEKEIYFKKTMTVEIKSINTSKDKKETNLTDQILISNNKNLKKKSKNSNELSQKNISEEKDRLKQEKILAEQAKIDKENVEADLIKELLLEENKLKSEKKEKLTKKLLLNDKSEEKIITNKIILSNNKNDKNLLEFDTLVKAITNKNLVKPFPNINDIPK